jgi:hypothetical protein
MPLAVLLLALASQHWERKRGKLFFNPPNINKTATTARGSR